MLLYIPNKLQKRNIYVADTSVGSQQNGLLFGKKVFFFFFFFLFWRVLDVTTISWRSSSSTAVVQF